MFLFDRAPFAAAACCTGTPVWCDSSAYFSLLVDSYTRSNEWEFLTPIFEHYVKVHGIFIENSKRQSRHTNNFLLLTDGNNMPTHTTRQIEISSGRHLFRAQGKAIGKMNLLDTHSLYHAHYLTPFRIVHVRGQSVVAIQWHVKRIEWHSLYRFSLSL